MNRQKSNLIRGIIFAVLALLLLLFIFSNSAQSRSESIDRSRALMAFLKPLLDSQGSVRHYAKLLDLFVAGLIKN